VLRLEQLDEGTQTRLLRVAAGMSQAELASHAGIDRRRLSEFERSRGSLTSEAVTKLRAVLRHANRRRDEAGRACP
jgi:transcriptional regulator with XRE-family HTH domain